MVIKCLPFGEPHRTTKKGRRRRLGDEESFFSIFYNIVFVVNPSIRLVPN